MYSVFIDEKGTQESFSISNPFSMRNKLAYGTDEIFGYIGNAWRIENSKMKRFSNDYEVIEKSYLETTQNPNRELKGSTLVKRNFDYGVASLKNRNLKFFSDFFKLLMEYNSDNLLFSINKMSVVVDNKLLYWFYLVDDKRLYPDVRTLKYIITKFLTIEANEAVIKAILDSEKSVKEVLQKIEGGMKEVINKNKNNKRMYKQLEAYKDVISVIKKSKHYNIKYSKDYTFDWNKVSYGLSLWLDEKKYNEELDPSSLTLYLDNGINQKYFSELEFGRIYENCDSRKIIGLRVTDLLVVIAGNYIKRLSQDCQYDYDNPEKQVLLDKKWFDLSEEQYDLLKLMAQYYLGGSKYTFVVDTYFDQERLFECFLRYINNYSSYKDFKVKTLEQHVKKHFQEFISVSQSMYSEFFSSSKEIRELYGSLEKAIEKGMLRPI